jgi:hypothetical protein
MQSFFQLQQAMHTTVTNGFQAVNSVFVSQIKVVLFPERRALHLADMSEIMSDIPWLTALLNCIVLSDRKNVVHQLKC